MQDFNNRQRPQQFIFDKGIPGAQTGKAVLLLAVHSTLFAADTLRCTARLLHYLLHCVLWCYQTAKARTLCLYYVQMTLLIKVVGNETKIIDLSALEPGIGTDVTLSLTSWHVDVMTLFRDTVSSSWNCCPIFVMGIVITTNSYNFS